LSFGRRGITVKISDSRKSSKFQAIFFCKIDLSQHRRIVIGNSYQTSKKEPYLCSLVITLLILIGLTAPSGFSTETQCDGQPVDLIIVKESRQIISDYGNNIWPGFGDSPAPVFLSAGEYDYLVGHPNPPDIFEEVKGGDELYRNRGHLLQRPAATTYPVGDVWSVAIPAREKLVEWVRTKIGHSGFQLSEADYLRTLVHESFHAFQMNSLGGPGNLANFGNTDSHREIQEQLRNSKWWEDRIIEVGHFLVRSLDAGNLENVREATGRALKLTDSDPSRLTSKILSFEKTIEWLEGTARYAGTMAMIEAKDIDHEDGTVADIRPPFELRSDLKNQLTQPLTGPTPIRDRLAAVGAVKAMILDKLYPGWKDGFLENKLGLDELLNSAINVPGPLRDFPITNVKLNGEDLKVALANSPNRRSHGLQHVAEIGPLDGMVFTFSRDVRTGFWMKDTEMSLQIGFFGSDGKLQESVVLEPCKDNNCPSYIPEKSFRFVLELPVNSYYQLSEYLPQSSKLTLSTNN